MLAEHSFHTDMCANPAWGIRVLYAFTQKILVQREGEEGNSVNDRKTSFQRTKFSARERKLPGQSASCRAQRAALFTGENTSGFSGVPGVSWLGTRHQGNIYQVTRVKPVIKFSTFFLPESPGFCLMLQTDGAAEFQVVADDILVFFIWLWDFFQVD